MICRFHVNLPGCNLNCVILLLCHSKMKVGNLHHRFLKGNKEWQVWPKAFTLGVAQSRKSWFSPIDVSTKKEHLFSASYVLKNLTKSLTKHHKPRSTSEFVHIPGPPFQCLVQLRSGNCKENNTKAIEHVTGASTLTSQKSSADGRQVKGLAMRVLMFADIGPQTHPANSTSAWNWFFRRHINSEDLM